MIEAWQDFRPKKRTWTHLIISNLALLIVSAGLLAGEWYTISNRQIMDVGKENRFLTTEWYLLQELRAQTDEELRSKDQEIASLKQLYQHMRAQNRSRDELTQIEEQIRKAESDRETIFLSSVKAGLRPSLAPSVTDIDAQATLSGGDSLTIDLLKQRVLSLEALHDQILARAEKAEASLADLRRMLPLATIPSSELTQKELSRAQIQSVMEAARESFRPETPPTVDQLKTISLVRAILSSPELRVKYPSLENSFDVYLERFGNREYTRGRATGYDAALQIFRNLPYDPK